jgi:hypothetical protein
MECDTSNFGWLAQSLSRGLGCLEPEGEGQQTSEFGSNENEVAD